MFKIAGAEIRILLYITYIPVLGLLFIINRELFTRQYSDRSVKLTGHLYLE
jgi:hypothetical protein